MKASIDIGSNTIRLSIYKIDKDNQFRQILHKKTMAGLYGYVTKEGYMSDSGTKVAIEVLQDYKSILESIGVVDAYYFATASLRNIKNGPEVVKEINNQLNISIDVISGESEGVLNYIGASYCMDMKTGLFVDIGGGSSELVFYKDYQVVRAISLRFGSLSLYSKYVADILPTKKEIKKIRQVVKDKLDEIDVIEQYQTISGSGGAIRGSRKMNNKFFKENTPVIPVKNITTIIKKVDEDYEKTIKNILKVLPERIHTIIPGLIVLETIAAKFGSSEILISNYGAREGYLITKLQNKV